MDDSVQSTNDPVARALIAMPQTSTLTDFVVAIHFADDIKLSILDLADWAKAFEEEFPNVQQLQRLGRLTLDNNPFQMMQVPELPVLMLRSADARFNLRLQADRLAFGWSRVNYPGIVNDYPGFDVLLELWQKHVEVFENWCRGRTGDVLFTNIVELSYNNAIPLEIGSTVTLSDTFAFLKSTGRRYNTFQVQWSEFLENHPGAARVNANAGVGNLPDGKPALGFSFVGLAPVTGPILGPETRSAIETLHSRILEMYASSIISARVDSDW